MLFGGLLLAALAGAVVASRERSGAAASAATVARNQQLELIARIGSLLQQSLSLGDLLPVFVVEVSDELALHGIGISLIADSGEFVRVFALGTSANEILPDAAALVPPPLAVEPGALVTVPLQRVGRVVGAFQGRATAGLTEAQIDTLLAVCAQLAAAIGNVRLYQDEQEMVARLRDLDHMKTKFVGSVSHELRTSVTAIEGFASLLQGDAEIDPARREDYMERIRRNARSLGLLIEDLLDFARFELSGVTGALRPTDLSDLVPNVVDQMSSVLANRTVSTIVEPNLVGIADALAVERILVNLLSNAAKYTPADSTVTVGLERDGDAAVLTVADNGPGIPAAERERIFDLFYRSDSSSVSARGVGIGLSLARQLVAHLKGTITVDEAPDGGARFRVMIPLAEELNPSPRVPETEQARPRAGG